MCGILGFIDRSPNIHTYHTRESLFKFLMQGLVIGELRGVHGTGMVSALEDKTFVRKAPIPGSVFAKQTDTQKCVQMVVDEKAPFAIVHHRAASPTTGKGKENTHPFSCGHLVGVHNGYIGNAERLPNLTKEQIKKADVDSLLLYQSLAETDDVGEVLKKAAGAYALSWYNKRDKTINFARNNARPLHFLPMPTGLVLFMSEAGMLSMLVKRIWGNHFLSNNAQIHSLSTGKLVSFSLIDPEADPEITDLPKPEYIASSYSHSYSDYSYANSHGNYSQAMNRQQDFGSEWNTTPSHQNLHRTDKQVMTRRWEDIWEEYGLIKQDEVLVQLFPDSGQPKDGVYFAGNVVTSGIGVNSKGNGYDRIHDGRSYCVARIRADDAKVIGGEKVLQQHGWCIGRVVSALSNSMVIVKPTRVLKKKPSREDIDKLNDDYMKTQEELKQIKESHAKSAIASDPSPFEDPSSPKVDATPVSKDDREIPEDYNGDIYVLHGLRYTREELETLVTSGCTLCSHVDDGCELEDLEFLPPSDPGGDHEYICLGCHEEYFGKGKAGTSSNAA